MLTDYLVTQLFQSNLEEQSYNDLLLSPHPYAIHIPNEEQRFNAMSEHRLAERFHIEQPWYLKLWQWITRRREVINDDIEMQEYIKNKGDFKPFLNIANAEASQNNEGAVLVIEKRPPINSMVFSGDIVLTKYMLFLKTLITII